MSQYRLHIDIPLPMNEEEAIFVTNNVMKLLNIRHVMDELKIDQINYRLGHDDDRQKSNYMEKTESGHVTNKKSKIDLTTNKKSV